MSNNVRNMTTAVEQKHFCVVKPVSAKALVWYIIKMEAGRNGFQTKKKTKCLILARVVIPGDSSDTSVRFFTSTCFQSERLHA